VLAVFVLRLSRSVECSCLVMETQVEILSARVILGLTEEFACERNPCPATPVVCNRLFIFFKGFINFSSGY